MNLLRKVLALFAAFVATVLVVRIPSFIWAVAFGGYGRTRHGFDIWVSRNYGFDKPGFWITLLVLYAIIGGIEAIASYDNDARPVFAFAPVVVIGVVMALFWGGMWWSNKSVPRYYNQSVEFAVTDVNNIPATLTRLTSGGTTGQGDCKIVGKQDVPSCVVEAGFPEDGWESRAAPLLSAVRFMKEASGDSQKVSLNENTISYIHNDGKTGGMWTAIRDGSGINVPMEGVVEWNGNPNSQPVVCAFEGDHDLGKAFAGTRSNSLTNLWYERFSPLFYNLSDVYGYCDSDGHPVVVFPVLKNVDYENRTHEAPAGVVIMKGSPSGDPVFERIETVEPGQIPGPVYPLSVAQKQREQHTWAAGRENESRNSFGYEPTSAETQSSNATEFQLRSLKDNRIYWVTPLTPRGSDSQLVVAYSVVPADVVSTGQLNKARIYVLDKDDDRIVNLEALERKVRELVSRENPGFFSSDGELREFTPAQGDTWHAYATIGGQAFYEITVSPSNEVSPKLISIGTEVPPGDGTSLPPSGGVGGTEVCGKAIGELSDAELADRMDALIEELKRRN